MHVCVNSNCNKKFEVNYSGFLMLVVDNFIHFECLNLISSLPPESQPFSIFKKRKNKCLPALRMQLALWGK